MQLHWMMKGPRFDGEAGTVEVRQSFWGGGREGESSAGGERGGEQEEEMDSDTDMIIVVDMEDTQRSDLSSSPVDDSSTPVHNKERGFHLGKSLSPDQIVPSSVNSILIERRQDDYIGPFGKKQRVARDLSSSSSGEEVSVLLNEDTQSFSPPLFVPDQSSIIRAIPPSPPSTSRKESEPDDIVSSSPSKSCQREFPPALASSNEPLDLCVSNEENRPSTLEIVYQSVPSGQVPLGSSQSSNVIVPVGWMKEEARLELLRQQEQQQLRPSIIQFKRKSRRSPSPSYSSYNCKDNGKHFNPSLETGSGLNRHLVRFQRVESARGGDARIARSQLSRQFSGSTHHRSPGRTLTTMDNLTPSTTATTFFAGGDEELDIVVISSQHGGRRTPSTSSVQSRGGRDVSSSVERGTGQGKTPKSKKRFVCPDCNKEFSQLRNFRYHRSRHEGTTQFACTCPICGKSFNDKGYLSSHLKIHRNAKEYKCEYCDKCFNQRVAYNMHIRIHTGLKPHQCHLCTKAFSRKMLLRQHLRTHTGERPYKCEVCQKAFADRSNMLLHQRLHSGQRPYKCEVCGKSFSKNHHLKTHLNHHAGIRPYQCEKCKACFSQSSNMKTHYKKCTGTPTDSPPKDKMTTTTTNTPGGFSKSYPSFFPLLLEPKQEGSRSNGGTGSLNMFHPMNTLGLHDLPLPITRPLKCERVAHPVLFQDIIICPHGPANSFKSGSEDQKSSSTMGQLGRIKGQDNMYPENSPIPLKSPKRGGTPCSFNGGGHSFVRMAPRETLDLSPIRQHGPEFGRDISHSPYHQGSSSSSLSIIQDIQTLQNFPHHHQQQQQSSSSSPQFQFQSQHIKLEVPSPPPIRQMLSSSSSPGRHHGQINQSCQQQLQQGFSQQYSAHYHSQFSHPPPHSRQQQRSDPLVSYQPMSSHTQSIVIRSTSQNHGSGGRVAVHPEELYNQFQQQQRAHRISQGRFIYQHQLICGMGSQKNFA